MSVYYLDASAWVKRYVHELGSVSVSSVFERRERIASSALGYLEVVAALSRRLPPADLAYLEPRLEIDWQSMARLPVTMEVIDRAVDLARQYKLRGADAVHLATALIFQNTLDAINEHVVFAASDNELLQAARSAGLQVENPMMVAPLR